MYCKVRFTKDIRDWSYEFIDIGDDSCNAIGCVYENYTGTFDVYVSFNPNKEVMIKSAKYYLFRYLAEKERL